MTTWRPPNRLTESNQVENFSSWAGSTRRLKCLRDGIWTRFPGALAILCQTMGRADGANTRGSPSSQGLVFELVLISSWQLFPSLATCCSSKCLLHLLDHDGSTSRKPQGRAAQETGDLDVLVLHSQRSCPVPLQPWLRHVVA